MKTIKIIRCCLLLLHVQLLPSFKQPTTLYCHGLSCKGERVQGLIRQNVIQNPAKGFNFNDHKKCLGQADDITTLAAQIDPDENYILYGRSRGGAAAVNYLAQHNPSNIQALILDAAPADMLNVVDEIQHKVGCLILHNKDDKEFAIRVLYPGYPQNSIPPVQAIENIENKHLPVFIVHSHNDRTVNMRSAWQYYKAFKQANFTDVYLCELQYGGHVRNASGSDSHIYKTALHSMYKKHGFDRNKWI